MRCSCCGNEVREDERYCNKCGQNNEYYVDKKPIEKVEIYNQPSSNSSQYSQPQPQTTYQQTNIYQQPTQQVPRKESGTMGILAIVFSVLGGWLGLLLAIIGLCTYKEPENRSKCKIALWIVLAWVIIGFLIGLGSI